MTTPPRESTEVEPLTEEDKADRASDRVCEHCGFPMHTHTFEDYPNASLVICPEVQ